jgi:hypothetical protein
MKFAATTLALVLATTLGAASVFAADPAPAKTLTPQQQKMKDCNAQAGDKKGDERKAFMKTCLKADNTVAAPAAPAKPMTQQEKMKVCNTQAGDKKGDERKAFMSTCLKGDNTAAPAAQ